MFIYFNFESRKVKLYNRMFVAVAAFNYSNEEKLALWRRWRKVTGYQVYGLIPDK